VVFCADGAGGLGGTTSSFEQVIAQEKVPLHVEKVEWSHGSGRFLLDHVHWKNLQNKGEQLAQVALGWRTQFPDKRICFVGQSAGCAVVVLAAAAMPADSVDRIVLLAPSLSSGYDLRPALRSTREGIDVFYSNRDWFVLGLGMAFSGTTDRRLPPVAGRVGFRPIVATPADKALYTRLRQHPWDSSVSSTGHKGGHYGADEPGHIRACILPLLAPAPGAGVDRFGTPP
jgi:pimeloyl-ACP methyl ester carboxylesterase